VPFTPDGALRMPDVPAELVGREEIRAGVERLAGSAPRKAGESR
jgi:hypothetical protein